MKVLLVIILVLHGLIHLFGFAKAFGLAPLGRITNKISKEMGILWLSGSAFNLLTAILLISENYTWTFVAFAAISVSQYLIITSWKDAKWGTIINIIILVASIIGYTTWRFELSYEKIAKVYLEKVVNEKDSLLTEFDLVELPEVVQKYIRYTGAVGKPKVKNMKIEFAGRIRKDEKSAWMPFSSQQYNFMRSSTRLFFMKASMKHLPVSGFHRFINGSASMDIRLFSLFKVQYQSSKEMGIAETVTFFNDMCCLAPATLIDKRIKWLEVENNKVKAQFTNNGISITAWLYFNDRNELINFTSDDRYAAQNDNSMKQLPWSTPLKNYKSFNGQMLPSYAEAIYNYPKGPLCYGTFTIIKVKYNCKDL